MADKPAPTLPDGAARPALPGIGPLARYTLLLSVGRADGSARVAQGEGADLGEALAGAAMQIRELLAGASPGGPIKIDLLLPPERSGIFDHRGRAALDRSLAGLRLPHWDLVLLPEELVSRRLLDGSNDLQSGRLRRYLEEGVRPPLDPRILEENPGRAGSPYTALTFESFVSPAGARLYRGNLLEPEVTPQALLTAAIAGGDYLVRHQQDDGAFDYSYESKRDELNDDYNLLRHAGSCYALYELYEATEQERFRSAATRGLSWLKQHLRGPRPEDAAQGASFQALVSPGEEAKLGGAALMMLALLKGIEVSPEESSQEGLDLVKALGRHLLFRQQHDGYWHSKYFYGRPDPKPFESIYYPGEAALALTRLARRDPQGPWLEGARRGALWLIQVRDAGKAVPALPHDHWLLMALSEMHQQLTDGSQGPAGLEEAAIFATHGEKIAAAIVGAQRRTAAYPDWIGTFYDPPRSTPTATRAEALVAMSRLARRQERDPTPYLAALRFMAAFQLRTQLTPVSALYLPRPDRAVGGFRRSLGNWEIRIDYVQHNVSALLGLRSLLLPPETEVGRKEEGQ